MIDITFNSTKEKRARLDEDSKRTEGGDEGMPNGDRAQGAYNLAEENKKGGDLRCTRLIYLR